MTKQSDTELVTAIRRFLQYHAAIGISEYPRTKPLQNFLRKQDASAPAQPKTVHPQRKRRSTSTVAKKRDFTPVSKKASLQDVREELGECRRCSLHTTRTNIIFGQGPERAELIIVADAPGPEDDRLAAPVQGAAGELLDKMLAAIGLSRAEVYITSQVKCFPGIDTKPGANEIKTCLPFLLRQIEIICPKVVCTMGLAASQTLLHSHKSVFQLRGRFYNINDICSSVLEHKIAIMPSLHPSLLLENPELKKASWQDLQMIKKKLEGND